MAEHILASQNANAISKQMRPENVTQQIIWVIPLPRMNCCVASHAMHLASYYTINQTILFHLI